MTTSEQATNASGLADKEISKMDDTIDTMNETSKIFFSARRKIADAACKVAENHRMDLQMLEYDSDEEKEDYLTGKSTACTHTFEQSYRLTQQKQRTLRDLNRLQALVSPKHSKIKRDVNEKTWRYSIKMNH